MNKRTNNRGKGFWSSIGNFLVRDRVVVVLVVAAAIVIVVLRLMQ